MCVIESRIEIQGNYHMLIDNYVKVCEIVKQFSSSYKLIKILVIFHVFFFISYKNNFKQSRHLPGVILLLFLKISAPDSLSRIHKVLWRHGKRRRRQKPDWMGMDVRICRGPSGFSQCLDVPSRSAWLPKSRHEGESCLLLPGIQKGNNFFYSW